MHSAYSVFNNKSGENMKKNKNYGKIIHACLLCELIEGPNYGYELMSKLEAYGIKEEDVNISTLYRCLNKLEDSKLINSSWEESESGPNKKVYNITRDGIGELKNIISFIEDRKKILENVMKRYENINIKNWSE